MTEAANPWEAANIPEWVPLLDVPGWIAKVFKHDPASVIPPLLRAVKASGVVHQVVGLKAKATPRGPDLPLGFKFSDRWVGGGSLIQVGQWDQVGFDPTAGTVAGRYDGDRHVLALLGVGCAVRATADNAWRGPNESGGGQSHPNGRNSGKAVARADSFEGDGGAP